MWGRGAGRRRRASSARVKPPARRARRAEADGSLRGRARTRRSRLFPVPSTGARARLERTGRAHPPGAATPSDRQRAGCGSRRSCRRGTAALRAAQPPEFRRRWADAVGWATADPLHHTPPRRQPDHLVERGVDSLGERARAENLACFRDLAAVDDQRGFVPSGYLFPVRVDILTPSLSEGRGRAAGRRRRRSSSRLRCPARSPSARASTAPTISHMTRVTPWPK